MDRETAPLRAERPRFERLVEAANDLLKGTLQEHGSGYAPLREKVFRVIGEEDIILAGLKRKEAIPGDYEPADFDAAIKHDADKKDKSSIKKQLEQTGRFGIITQLEIPIEYNTIPEHYERVFGLLEPRQMPNNPSGAGYYFEVHRFSQAELKKTQLIALGSSAYRMSISHSDPLIDKKEVLLGDCLFTENNFVWLKYRLSVAASEIAKDMVQLFISIGLANKSLPD